MKQMCSCLVILSISIIVVLLGCAPAVQDSAAGEISGFKKETDAIVRRIAYIQDPRLNPPSCFAYYWGGAANGGPALATIDCAQIPAELLTTANLAKLPRTAKHVVGQ